MKLLKEKSTWKPWNRFNLAMVMMNLILLIMRMTTKMSQIMKMRMIISI